MQLKLNECAQVRDNAILAFAENCPNILEIDLHQCNQIGNGPVNALLSKGNSLRELRLANCELIDDHAFLSLHPAKSFEHLRILDLTSCARLTDAAVQKIIDSAPRLRNLVLAKCRNITDASVFAISRLGKNLHYVHLGHCGQITDEGVKRLVNNCNRIRYIDLGCCTNLTDESVRRLSLLPKLKRIGLVKCSSITDDSVLALAEAAFRPRVRRDGNGVYVGGEYWTSSLERVHLSYCVNLTLKVCFPSVYAPLPSPLTPFPLPISPSEAADTFTEYHKITQLMPPPDTPEPDWRRCVPARRLPPVLQTGTSRYIPLTQKLERPLLTTSKNSHSTSAMSSVSSRATWYPSSATTSTQTLSSKASARDSPEPADDSALHGDIPHLATCRRRVKGWMTRWPMRTRTMTNSMPTN